VSAKRKVGKSAFMVGIVDTSSINQRVPGLILTLEMGVSEWLDRLFAHRTGIDSQRISEGTCSNEEMRQISHHVMAVQTAPLAIEDTDCFNVSHLESLIRYYRIKTDIGYAIVDHAQLVQFPSSRSDRSDELDKLGSKLKTLAQRLGITIFLLSQTNDRGVTFGSSMLEAHLTKLIHIEIPGDESEYTNKRHVNLKLNRSGKTGGVESTFDGATCSFREITKEREPETDNQRSFGYE
jgi:replicative DNA helicase